MNLDRNLFGRVTINDQQISLGHAPIVELAKRLIEQYRRAKSSNSGRISIIVEISERQLLDSSLMNDEQRLLNEFNSLISSFDPDEPTDWPGITMGRVAEVSSSPEYQRYQMIATNPSRRIGLSHNEINQIKSAYFDLFPDCAPHFPTWID